MKKIVLDGKVQMASISKTQSEVKLEMKKFETLSGTSETSLNNRIQEIEELIPGLEYKTEEINTPIN